MTTLEQTQQVLKQEKPLLENKFNVGQIGVFGSMVRGEQEKPSDLDILVEFLKPMSLFSLLELEDYLSNRLGVKVDLVLKKALKPAIGRQILKEVVYV